MQKYGVDPRELSQEQLYKLALILQLLQAQEKTGPTFNVRPTFLVRKLAFGRKAEHSFSPTQVPLKKT